MPRARLGAARHRKKKRVFKAAKGYYGSRSKLYRMAKEAVVRAGCMAYRDRRNRKRDFRRLWIIRVTAACEGRGIRYGQFMNALKQANITLNRKMLAEVAIHDPEGFDKIVELTGLKPAQAA